MERKSLVFRMKKHLNYIHEGFRYVSKSLWKEKVRDVE